MLDFADFALQEQLEDNLMVSSSRAWYNGWYTMAPKPIKSFELHYTMIQFLIIRNKLPRINAWKFSPFKNSTLTDNVHIFVFININPQ